MGLDELRARRHEILQIAARHGARDVRIFGSVVRGEAGSASDVDVLVDMDKGRSLLDLVAFWQDLEELLACKVDVVTDGGISPYLRDRIYAEAQPL
jgi:predicted nucleotidyltransferase